MSDRILTLLQSEIAARLEADPILRAVPVVTERLGDIDAAINQSMATVTERYGRIGACLLVMQLTGNVDDANIPNPELRLEPVVRVLESPLMSDDPTTGIGMPALEIARRVSRVLHHFEPGGLASTLVADNPHIAPVADPAAPVAYDVRFLCVESDPDRFVKIATPEAAIEPADDTPTAEDPVTVTLTCATGGAAIYWTTDGSYPWPLNPHARLYSAPFEVTEPMSLRVAAHAEDKIASDVAHYVIT